MSKIVGIGASEGVKGIPVVKKSRQIPQQVSLDNAVIGPVKTVSQTVKEAIAICRLTDYAESFSRDAIADVIQVTCVHGRARVGGLADSTIIGPQEGPIVCQKPRSCMAARQTSTGGD